ncbi:MAG: spermidine synthase [Phenylobacterium sp.]|uniref:spermine/spermidine synthase domain-containing protein n=1 Tax=Phenylobacterium sp. TaxID=1871053 RepID=UPI001B6C19C8|nr:MnmC family methyltransferase [Phenylobacterium sp.]MBP7815764.1 spermidine synthase [Phenylobacterium sp.]MBP9232857.1 spermidine synthase [Phenylobacterium sp.]
MIAWEHLDTATVPDAGGELRLMRRGAEYSIMTGAIELMNSRLSGSEEALATLVIARVGPAARLLIGGYGMGFTLRAALAALGPAAKLVVAELVPQVVDWARGPMAHLAAGCLEDPRVRVVLGDVSRAIGAGAKAYDAILLDVDNGPEGLSRKENDRLYSRVGLAAARAALSPGGVLAVWSSGPSEAFTKRLTSAGFAVEVVPVRAGGGKRGARHVIWLATNPG